MASARTSNEKWLVLQGIPYTSDNTCEEESRKPIKELSHVLGDGSGLLGDLIHQGPYVLAFGLGFGAFLGPFGGGGDGGPVC